MKASVAATEMLKLVMPPSSLHSMNSRMSGWSTRRMPMFAPRRVPPCFTASVAALNTRRKDDRARRPAAGRVHDVVLRPEAREREAGAAARLLDDGGRLHRLEDLLHGVADRQHVAGRVLERVPLARVHERRGVRQEVALDHHVVEGGRRSRGRPPGSAPSGPPPAAMARGDPPAHLLRGLPDLSLLAGEIPLPQHAERRLGPVAYLGRSCLGRHDVLTDFLPHPMVSPAVCTPARGVARRLSHKLDYSPKVFRIGRN